MAGHSCVNEGGSAGRGRHHRGRRRARRLGLGAVAFALALSVTIPGTVPGAGAHAAVRLVIGINQYPATLHPSINAMMATSYVLGMVRRPLTAFDPAWRLHCFLCTEVPSLAAGTARVETRPDGGRGMAVTYTLEAAARWGDGTPMTTRDVLLTWQVGRSPESGYSNASLFTDDIVDITAHDDKRFTVHRARLECDYDELNDFQIIPAHLEGPVFERDPAHYRQRTLYQSDPTEPGLYAGPYRVTALETGSFILLERNPHWWGPVPAFPEILVRVIENNTALAANLLAGDIDMVPGEVGLTLDQVLALRDRYPDRFTYLFKTGLFYEHLELNHDNPILADVRVRQALLLLIDRTAISAQLFEGRQPVAHNTINPLDPVFDPAFRHYAYDPDEAARLLAAAGWERGPDGVRRNVDGDVLRLTLMTTAGERTRELVEQVLQSDWGKAGIVTRIENQPPRVLFGRTLRERAFDGLALFAWLSSPGNIPRTILHSSMIPTQENGYAGQNYTGFRHDEMDRVLDQLRTECEQPARQELWRRLQQIYANELPALPLYYRAQGFILPLWLEGLVATGHQYPSTLWVEQWRQATP